MEQTSYKYLIVGGGAAGVSAAEMLRTSDKEASIAVVSDEIHPLYSRVMLSKPNFFLGKVPFEKIYMKGHEWYEENKIDFLKEKIANKIDGTNKILFLSDGSEIRYEKLLLATGVSVRKLEVPGSEKNGIHYLRTLEDGKNIIDQIKTSKKAVVLGAGFIGFEMADLMVLAGLDTTVVIREPHFWYPTLDESSGKIIEDAMIKKGVKFIKNNEIKEVLGDKNISGIILKDGQKIDCDILLCGIGVKNDTDWLLKSSLSVGRGILANEFLETNLKDVWTAGDIAEYKDLILEENIQMGNWVNAVEQGRVAAKNMLGGKTPFKFVSFYTTLGFGVSVAFVGDVRNLPDRKIISRGSLEKNSYTQIIIDSKNELVGATILNHPSEMTTLAKIIEQNINVSDYLNNLENTDFDLRACLKSNH